jgi:tetrahydromethanopterin S-methyltransferase subunit H
MFSFIRDQKVVDILGIKFGGQPGMNPTVLMGTIFYGRDYKIMDDGAFKLAREKISNQEQISSETGIPGLLDVYIKEERFIEPILDTILESTDKPFAIDSSDSQVRAKTIEFLSKVGALDRTIYNSINLGITEKELESLTKYAPAAAIMLGYNPRDLSVDGRMDILNTGAGMVCVPGKGLLDIAEEAGIEKLLIDTGATPFGSMSAETLRSIPVFKSHFGLPVGCSIHNTLESWNWMKDLRKSSPETYNCVDAAANSLVPLYCGDYIVYGPVSACNRIFPSIAFADKLMAEGANDYFGVEPSQGHPYSKLI